MLTVRASPCQRRRRRLQKSPDGEARLAR